MGRKSLNKVYYDVKVPGSFGGVDSLKRASKQSRKSVKKWLESQDTYTLHKPIRHKISRRRVISGGPGQQLQIDLIDVKNIKEYNDGMSFILTCIDVFSKYAHAIPLRDKTGESVKKALEKIFLENIPFNIQGDAGGEFIGKKVQNYLKDKKVKFFSTKNEEIKASIVERFNRTLKEKMWRYFTKFHTRRYINVLPDIIRNYNSSFHTSIQMAPNEVNSKNQETVWDNLYKLGPKLRKKILNIGDRVRISKLRRRFEKSYLPSWTTEIFTVSRIRHDTQPLVYVLKDDNGEELQGTFYFEELQKVSDKEVYRISEIIKTRGRGFYQQYLVRWLGYPASFDSWVSKKDIVTYDG